MAPRRRAPQQERSRRTVERILDAAEQVLERDGDRGASTNRIAAEAGVSPGSLYQYFADRDELLLAVTRRFVERFEGRLVPALRRAAREDPATAPATVVRAMVEALEEQATLLRALVGRVPGDRQEEVTRAIRARVTDFAFHSLSLQRPELSPDEVERVAWTLVELGQALPVRYVVDRPPIEREAFVQDAARLLMTHAALAGGSRAGG